MVLAKRFLLQRPFQGEPKLDDFELVSEELPPLKDGEVLAQAEYLSVDPYMRVFPSRVRETMLGSQVARVLESRAGGWAEGERFVGDLGWCTHAVFQPASLDKAAFFPTTRLPDLGDLPPSLGLGVLGMPGNTAYFALQEALRPKEGETVAVTSAAGVVGSTAGQIAKIMGCRVVGFAGTDDKVKWVKDELGFDAAFNYKTKDIAEALKDGAPKGIDCYFDNVGGELSNNIINHMNKKGRIVICGSISTYNRDRKSLPKTSITQSAIITNKLKRENFAVTQWKSRWMEGINQNLQWIREGKIKYRETVTEGFDNMPSAFIGLLQGQYTGKAVVKV